MGYSIKNLAKYVDDNSDLMEKKNDIMIRACSLTEDGNFMVAGTAEMLIGNKHADIFLNLLGTDISDDGHLEIIAHSLLNEEGQELVNARLAMLLKKIKKRKMCDRPGYLAGVYKQLIRSHKGRIAKGEFRVFRTFEEKSRFSVYMIGLLSYFGLHSHASRLQKQCFR